MKIIKIKPSPTVVSHILKMKPGEVLRFDLSHRKQVVETAGRKMKDVEPNYRFPTITNREGGFIEIRKEPK